MPTIPHHIEVYRAFPGGDGLNGVTCEARLRADDSLIEYVTDRPGHDRRYSLGSEKVKGLGWEAQVRFADGLERTVSWYRDNRWWWEPIRSGDYRAYYERQYGRALG